MSRKEVNNEQAQWDREKKHKDALIRSARVPWLTPHNAHHRPGCAGQLHEIDTCATQRAASCRIYTYNTLATNWCRAGTVLVRLRHNL